MANIDLLQIEIESNSLGASKNIKELGVALGELKKNGGFNTAVKNMNELRKSLQLFNGVPSSYSKIVQLKDALAKLSEVKSASNIGTVLKKLADGMRELGGVDVSAIGPKIKEIAPAFAQLSGIKAGGIGTMVNGLSKLKQVTASLDEKTIGEFAKRVETLTEKLGPLSEKMTTIKAGFSGINSKARSAGAGAKQMGDDFDVASINLSSVIDIVKEAINVLNKAIQKFKEVTASAVEWDGITARFGRGFGDQAQETYAWIQRLNEEMGINVQQFMQYSSVYATMLTGFGVASRDASKMALGYTELTYDIWAGYNDIYKSFAEAADAVKSAIAGEVEPVRRAGFTIVEATLEQTAANHGLKISLENATEAQKSYLRYLALVDQAHAQGLVGTYAKELGTAEGLMRTASQQVKSLSQAFGSLFLPILVKIMPYVQAFVELLTEAVHWVARLFGVTIQSVDWSGFNSGAGSAAENTENLGGALGNAAKAAKALKNATMGFDELNVISPPTDSASGSAGGSAGNGFSDLNVDSLWDASIFDDVQSQVAGIVDKVKEWLGLNGEIDSWADFFETRLGRIITAVGIVGGGIAAWEVTKKFLSGIETLQKLLASPTYSIAIGLVLTITGITLAVDGFSDAIKNGLDGINFSEILGGGLLTTGGAAILGSKLAAWISTAFAGSTVANAIATAGANLGIATAGGVGAALAGAGAAVVLGIPAMFVGIYDAIVNEIDWLNAGLTAIGGAAAGAGVAAILTAAGTAVAPGVGTLIGLGVGLVIDGVILMIQEWDKISAFFKKFFGETLPGWWNSFTDWLGGIPGAIGDFFASMPEKISKWFEDMWQPIKDFDWKQFGYDIGYKTGTAVKEIGNAFKKFFTETLPGVWEDVQNAFSTFFTKTLPNFFTKTIPELWETIQNAFETFFSETLPNFFSNAGEWFVDVGQAIWDGIVDGWNTAMKAIGDFIDGFIQGFKDALGIHSPSTVFRDKIGKFLGEGILEGIASMFKAIGKWVDKNIVQPFNKAVDGVLSFAVNVKNTAGTWWGNVKSWWSDKVGDVKSFGTNVKNTAGTWWGNVKSWWGKKVGNAESFATNVKNQAGTWWSNTKSWWSKKVGNAESFATNVKNQAGTWWGNVKGWWGKKVGQAESFATNVKNNAGTWWSNTKKWWSNKVGSAESFSTNVKNKASTWWSDAKRWWSGKVGNAGNFTTGVKNNASTWWSNVKKWWDDTIGELKLKIKTPSITVKWNYDIPDWQKTVADFLFDKKALPKLGIEWKADGGFVDQGQMFIAREAGPEMVGRIGSRNAVANNDQIVTAISEGVYSAVMAAMSGNNNQGNQEINIYLDGKKITASVEKRQKERGANLMTGGMVYGY